MHKRQSNTKYNTRGSKQKYNRSEQQKTNILEMKYQHKVG